MLSNRPKALIIASRSEDRGMMRNLEGAMSEDAVDFNGQGAPQRISAIDSRQQLV